MKYIFNANGKCMAGCNYEPNTEDLASRGEVAVEGEQVYQLSEIQLVNGLITTITKTDAEEFNELKTARLSTIKTQLSATDYKCSKYVDGDLSEAEYAEVKTLRHNLRTAYNAIEATTTIEEISKI